MTLLILDLDETLVHATEACLDRDPDFEVGPYAVYRRPGLDSFLSTVSSHFDLAVWTSSTRFYADPVVAAIFPPSTDLKFVWSRERCTMRFYPEQHDYEWTKNLGKVKRKGYQLEQVLMVDDTPAKLAKHYGNLVRVRPFFGDLADRELFHLGEYLPTLAKAPNVRKIEKRSWRKTANET
ncbi:HAD family hydrolase [Xanthomonas sp. 4461]|uniref:NIF family HAD-type phosphatase n=1 Tax=Xanthomonas sp. 4461 TaxID=3035313 RepID=UPI002168CCB0|nr:HAD family hydrolase [Xanthomonas sp. 4461]MCS3811349.1 RNA polymerase II subunit A small phosphatase-like protein [Xanthomonas sp. 4461]